MTLQDLLIKVCGNSSDYSTAKKLGVSKQAFSNYRKGNRIPNDDILNKMIEISGLNPVEVYMAAYAEKVHNPIVAEAFRNQSQFAA